MEAWQQILKDCGYPTDILVVDFETYFDTDYTLGKMSTIEYINSPNFEMGGLGIGGTEGHEFFSPADDPVFPHTVGYALKKFNWDIVTVVCLNARFDITVLQTKFDIIPKYIIDIKDLASHYDSRMSHHLKDLAKMFKLKPKGDTMNFKGLHYQDMTPEQKKAYADYCLNDVEIETELFKILLPKLSNPAIELWFARHTLDLWLTKSFEFDRDLADSLKVQMRCKIKEAIDKAGTIIETGKTIPMPASYAVDEDEADPEVEIFGSDTHTEETIMELRSARFAGYLKSVLNPGEEVPMKQGKPSKKNPSGMIPALAQADDGCLWLLAHPKQEVRDLMLARQAVKRWPLHIGRIDNLAAQTEANGGTLRIPLNYYGCHTGRASGGEDINLLNFGGRGRTGVGIDPMITSMRGLLRAPAGYVLGMMDSAQIEARILAWLAGQEDLIDGFRNNEDIYSAFATRLFRSPIRKAKKTDPEPVSKYLDIKRGFGKDAILGSGYGMGPAKFYQRCLQNATLRPLFDNGTYTFDFIKRLIATYRTTYARIPEFWKSVENVFYKVIKYPHLGCVATGTPIPIWMTNSGGTVMIKLPSGRLLYYRHCKVAEADGYSTIQYHYGHLWGGSITENIVQSISADLLRFWIYKCEEAGLPVLLHTYDEIVSKIKSENAQKGLDKMKEIMSTIPEWGDGLPVDAEGKYSECFCK